MEKGRGSSSSKDDFIDTSGEGAQGAGEIGVIDVNEACDVDLSEKELSR